MSAGLAAVGLLVVACAPAGQPGPTPAPPKPAESKPAEAPKPAATSVPAKSPDTPAKPAATAPAKAQAKAAASPVAKAGPLEDLTEAERKTVEDFYRGKTVTIVVGFAAGGGYDTYSRLLGRYLSKYVPGNPNVIVENKTGAGSLIAANYLYNLAKKDGTELGMFDEYLVLGQMAGKPGIEFDGRKFNWIGNPAHDPPVCAFRSDLGFRTFDDLLKSGKEIVLGATGTGSQPYATPAAIKAVTGANFKIVTGYDGTSKIRLAVDNREADGACWGWSSVKVTAASWFEGSSPFARVLVQSGTQRHKDLSNVPLAREFVKVPEKIKLFDVTDAASEFTRPWALPPGVPTERVKAIRVAAMRALADPEAKAEAEKSQLILEPQDYRVVERAVSTVLSIPANEAAEYATTLGLK
jgi:tripartite-type tricarboxylate transporter receptor subunit TctC